jgi:flavin-dependent dehydrogenase
MVIGGGIAGIQTAMDLADTGYYVYLVERSSAWIKPFPPTTALSESWHRSW